MFSETAPLTEEEEEERRRFDAAAVAWSSAQMALPDPEPEWTRVLLRRQVSLVPPPQPPRLPRPTIDTRSYAQAAFDAWDSSSDISYATPSWRRVESAHDRHVSAAGSESMGGPDQSPEWTRFLLRRRPRPEYVRNQDPDSVNESRIPLEYRSSSTESVNYRTERQIMGSVETEMREGAYSDMQINRENRPISDSNVYVTHNGQTHSVPPRLVLRPQTNIGWPTSDEEEEEGEETEVNEEHLFAVIMFRNVRDRARRTPPLELEARIECSKEQLLACEVIDAADKTGEEVPPPQFFCPLSLTAMRDPHIAEDGICYERAYIVEAMRHSLLSPITRENMCCRTTFPCAALRSIMQNWARSFNANSREKPKETASYESTNLNGQRSCEP